MCSREAIQQQKAVLNLTVTEVLLPPTAEALPTGTYNYNTSSKELTVISGGDTSHATVTNLTSNNLHFKQDETQTIGGATVRVTTDADYSR
jgi:hypothetical protein